METKNSKHIKMLLEFLNFIFRFSFENKRETKVYEKNRCVFIVQRVLLAGDGDDADVPAKVHNNNKIFFQRIFPSATNFFTFRWTYIEIESHRARSLRR